MLDARQSEPNAQIFPFAELGLSPWEIKLLCLALCKDQKLVWGHFEERLAERLAQACQVLEALPSAWAQDLCFGIVESIDAKC